MKVGERAISEEQNTWITNLVSAINNIPKAGQQQQPMIIREQPIINMNIQTIDAQSFDSKIMERKNTIAAAFVAAGRNNHPARRTR